MADVILDQDTALAEFDRSRESYERSYDPVPDDALKYVPDGEDYALGGLVPHVTDVILHYNHVFDLIQGSGFKLVRAVDPDDEARKRRERMIGSGFSGEEKPAVFAEMRTAHESLAGKLRGLSQDDFIRSAPVLYGSETQDPFDTRAADIVHWLIDHYIEHVEQVAQLIDRWSEGKEPAVGPARPR